MRDGNLVLRTLTQDLARALEAGQRLSQLRADGHDLNDGRDQEAEEQRVR